MHACSNHYALQNPSTSAGVASPLEIYIAGPAHVLSVGKRKSSIGNDHHPTLQELSYLMHQGGRKAGGSKVEGCLQRYWVFVASLSRTT